MRCDIARRRSRISRNEELVGNVDEPQRPEEDEEQIPEPGDAVRGPESSSCCLHDCMEIPIRIKPEIRDREAESFDSGGDTNFYPKCVIREYA